MARKLLMDFSAEVENGIIKLKFHKSNSYFESDLDIKIKDQLVIRIYRKLESEFEFGIDTIEYFDGIDYTEAELIFEGVLPVFYDRRFEFADNQVSIGCTYTYWVSSNLNDIPIGPVSLKVRDDEVWWSQAKIDERMSNIEKNYPDIATIKKYGITTKRRNINGVIVGNSKKTIALIGTIHAGESGPELIIPVLERMLKSDRDLLEQVGVAALPSVNIDEREKIVRGVPYYLRTNSNGVDINRNFNSEWEKIDYNYGYDTSDQNSSTYRGNHPESEFETQAVVKFIDEVKPSAVFAFHALACICDDRYIGSEFAVEDKQYVDASYKIAESHTRGFNNECVKNVQLEFVDCGGSLSAWLHSTYRIPAFEMEYNYHKESKLSLTDRTTRQMINLYQEKHYRALKLVLEYLNRH